MQVCPRCGSETAELVSFCPTCGARLGLEVQPAALGRRFLAFLIDLVLVPLVWFCFVMAFAIAWGLVVGIADIPHEDEDPVFDRVLEVLMVVSLLAVPVLYHWLFEGSRHAATPGKLLLGLKVATTEGTPVGWAGALGRAVVRLASTVALGVGFLPALFTHRKQALHDVLAGTVVVPRPVSAPALSSADAESALAGPARTGRSAPA